MLDIRQQGFWVYSRTATQRRHWTSGPGLGAGNTDKMRSGPCPWGHYTSAGKTERETALQQGRILLQAQEGKHDLLMRTSEGQSVWTDWREGPGGQGVGRKVCWGTLSLKGVLRGEEALRRERKNFKGPQVKGGWGDAGVNGCHMAWMPSASKGPSVPEWGRRTRPAWRTCVLGERTALYHACAWEAVQGRSWQNQCCRCHEWLDSKFTKTASLVCRYLKADEISPSRYYFFLLKMNIVWLSDKVDIYKVIGALGKTRCYLQSQGGKARVYLPFTLLTATVLTNGKVKSKIISLTCWF